MIVGAGGFGRELLEMLWDAFSPRQFRFKGFLASPESDVRRYGVDADVLDDPESYQPAPQDRFLLAIGDMDARRRIVESILSRGGVFLSFVHPKAHIASTAQLGRGAVIYPFAVVSNRARLADYVHLNYFASVGHDCLPRSVLSDGPLRNAERLCDAGRRGLHQHTWHRGPRPHNALSLKAECQLGLHA